MCCWLGSFLSRCVRRSPTLYDYLPVEFGSLAGFDWEGVCVRAVGFVRDC